MAIQAMYTQSATTYRDDFVTDSTIKRTFVMNISSIACLVHPHTSENASIVPGGFAKQWMMFCNNADIIEGDKVVVDDVEYRVLGVEMFEFGINSHMEVTLAAFAE